MSQQQLSSPEGAHEGDTPGERVTLSVPIHLAAPTRRTVVREGSKRARRAGRIPRNRMGAQPSTWPYGVAVSCAFTEVG
jgi:hypothetical protein